MTGPGDRVEIAREDYHGEMTGRSGTVQQIGKGFVKIRLDGGGSFCTTYKNLRKADKQK